ncbi:MAG: TonB family protein [Sulfurovum sp.]|nr:TonB family protein [Sulfurovum sp.]
MILFLICSWVRVRLCIVIHLKRSLLPKVAKTKISKNSTAVNLTAIALDKRNIYAIISTPFNKLPKEHLTRNGYPPVAERTQQQGTNIVSFYLHPNGDISGLKLKHRIGYASLDDNTLNIIQIAYKNYPLPNQKTRLIFYVEYNLY